MAPRHSIAQQINSADTALVWIRQIGAVQLGKLCGVRQSEVDYVIDGMTSVVATLEWAANNRDAFAAWLAERPRSP